MIRTIIVDDEKFIRDELKYFLSKIEDVEIVGETGEGDQVMSLIKEKNPDIIFLDIELRYANGMTIARNIMDMENPPQIIISTAYDKYAVMGFEISVADYILKPFSLDRIKRAIKKAVGNIDDKTISGKNNDDEILRKIAVCRENRMFLIDISDVYYFESKGNDVEIVTLSYVYKAAMTLKSLENSLDENKFIRIHKSFIVNADYIDEIIPWFNYTCKILLKDSMGELMVSRSNYKDFKEKFRI